MSKFYEWIDNVFNGLVGELLLLMGVISLFFSQNNNVSDYSRILGIMIFGVALVVVSKIGKAKKEIMKKIEETKK